MEDIHRPERKKMILVESILRHSEEALRKLKVRRKLKLSRCPESQKEEIQELCIKIEKIVRPIYTLWDCFILNSAGCVLWQKYKNGMVREQFEEGTETDWNAVKEELQRMLQEYDSSKRDERIYGISSVTWQNVFKTHGRSIPESMKRDILDTCKEIEEEFQNWYHYSWSPRSVRTSYQKLGQTLLTNIESTDWVEIKESLQSLQRPRFVTGHVKPRNGIEIYVDQLGGTQFKIENVSMTDNVESLSRKVEEQTGIPKRKFTLIHNGYILKPGQSLASTNIRHGSHVQLFPLKKGQDQPTNLKDYVVGTINDWYRQIEKLCKIFPTFFQDQKRKLSEKDFVSVSQLICNGLEFLGMHLGLPNVRIQHITKDNTSEGLRIFGMLKEWHARNPLEATAGKLLDAIKHCKLACDLETLERVLLTGMPIHS